MKKTSLVGLILALQVLAFGNARAATDLFDWGFNIDGTSYCDLGPCDNDGLVPASLPSEINISGFDFISGLGSISVTMTGAGLHTFDAFFDHEIDEVFNTFFNENGAVNGVLAAGQSFEIDEPGFLFGDILTNFNNSNLDNANAVPAGLEDDVSMAIGWDFVLAVGEKATIDILLSLSAPTSDFFLTHTDPDSDESIYFSSKLSISQIPIPAAAWLFGSGLLGLIGISRRKKAA